MFPGSNNPEPFALLYTERTNMSSVSPSQDKLYAQLSGEHCRESGRKDFIYSFLDANLPFVKYVAQEKSIIYVSVEICRKDHIP